MLYEVITTQNGVPGSGYASHNGKQGVSTPGQADTHRANPATPAQPGTPGQPTTPAVAAAPAGK